MAVTLPIYMDHMATTPVAPEVFEAMRPYFCERFGNPASRNHAFGWVAEEAVELARGQVAHLLGCKPAEIVWTSGATEANNLAIKGVAAAYQEKGRHIVTSRTEHHAVLDTCKRLEREGYQVTYLPVDNSGRVDPTDVERAIRRDTILISIMDGFSFASQFFHGSPGRDSSVEQTAAKSQHDFWMLTSSDGSFRPIAS